MATKDDQDALRLLVQYVSRAFYDPKYVVIMDQLARHPVLKDDDLAGRIGLQAKELNKYMAVLVNDHLVQVHRQNELKEGAQRSVGKQYYYIDYKYYCNVVKWRVSEMHRIIDSTLRNELDNKGYICPNCKATFSPLEADRLLDISRGTFVCDVCPTSPDGPHEVIPNEDEDKLRGSKDRMERFNRQTRFVREGLRKTESMTLPAFDVAQWIRNNAAEAEKQKQTQNGNGLKIAGAGGKQEESSISVLMSIDKDEATRRREREAEAEAKRQQNIMPSWHLKSTISNDLTALGVAVANRQATNAKLSTNETILSSLSKSTSTTADILSGLGRPKPETKEEPPEIHVVEDQTKSEEEQTAEFYDQYYAQLEARSTAQSASQTPQAKILGSDLGSLSCLSFGTSSGGIGLGLGLNLGSDEEERKPDAAQLETITIITSSSSGSLKRSRSGSIEPDGAEGMRGSKALRSNTGTPVFSHSESIEHSPSPSTEFGPPPTDAEGESGEMFSIPPPEAPLDEPVVMVGGEPMPLSTVTQEIADEKMTPEEYTIWVELVMNQ